MKTRLAQKRLEERHTARRVRGHVEHVEKWEGCQTARVDHREPHGKPARVASACVASNCMEREADSKSPLLVNSEGANPSVLFIPAVYLFSGTGNARSAFWVEIQVHRGLQNR